MLKPSCLWSLTISIMIALAPSLGCVSKPYHPPEVRHNGYALASSREIMALTARLSPAGQGLSSWLELWEPLAHTLAYLRTKPRNEAAVLRGDVQVTWGRLTDSVLRLLWLLHRLDDDPGLLAREFAWYRLGPEPVLTGYYAPVIDASATPDEEYRYPLYAVPPDLMRINLGSQRPEWRGQVRYYRIAGTEIVPYYSRREIELDGVLAGRNLEIAWVKDPLALFYLHVQGSGYLRMRDGSLVKAQYGSKNGRPFKSISQVLLEKGQLRSGELSRSRIAACLAANPDKMHDWLAENESYVFFQLGHGQPRGAMGQPLTAMVSLASDPRIMPLGALMAYATDLPAMHPGGTPRRVFGLGLAQDAGSAIKGNRFDLFCGIGQEREYLASHIKVETTVYLLLSREQALAEGPVTQP